MSTEITVAAPNRAPATRRVLKLVALVLLLAGLYLAARLSGAVERMDVASVRAVVEAAGAVGVVVFVGLFAVGSLVQLPGMLFVASAILLYGKLAGYFVALLGAFTAVCVTFLIARAVGGDALAAIERPWLRRMLDRLQARPIRTLVIMRLLLFISPPINYALGLTPLRFRDYAIGSALGLALPMATATLLFDWLFTTPWVRSLLF